MPSEKKGGASEKKRRAWERMGMTKDQLRTSKKVCQGLKILFIGPHGVRKEAVVRLEGCGRSGIKNNESSEFCLKEGFGQSGESREKKKVFLGRRGIF
jgi:hypothetical protein